MNRILFSGLLLIVNIGFGSQSVIYGQKATSQQSDTSAIIEKLCLSDKLKVTDSAKARNYLLDAFNQSKFIRFNKGIAKSSLELGYYYLNRFDLTHAEKYFTISLNAWKALNNKYNVAKILNNLGIISEKKGDYSNSISYYLNAFEIYDSLDYTEGISALANNLGIVYYLMNYPHKALGFLRLSLDLKNETGDTLSSIYTYQNLGDIHFELWNYDSASYYYQQCHDLANKYNDISSAGKALNSMGVINMIKGDNESAREYFDQSISYSKGVNDFQNLSSVLDNLGLLYLYSDKLELATAYFDSSLTIASKNVLKEEMKNAHQHLAEVYSMKNNYKEAFLNLQSYDDLKSDLLFEQSQVAGIEALFVKQKQENRILILEREKEKKKAQLIILVSILLIIILLSVAGYFIFRIRHKVLMERTMAEQEKFRFKAVIEGQEMERKRIAGDLHDSVGQMLSLSKMHLSEFSDEIQMKYPDQANSFNHSMNLIDDACQEVRNISHNLMPGALIRLGLGAAIKELVRKINSSKKLKISFKNDLKDERIKEKIEISLFRIIQELFNNILKHSKASDVFISLLKKSEDLLQLIIKDNGIGFDPHIIEKSEGVGWKNIYSRLAIINGTMKVTSAKERGTNIEIQVIL